MQWPTVLVVGAPRDTRIRNALLDAGLTPVVRETILSVIAALRREHFLAVAVDPESADVDLLEVILNIRDLDERLRIFVLSDRPVDLGGLQDGKDVSVVSLNGMVRELSPRLASAVEHRE